MEGIVISGKFYYWLKDGKPGICGILLEGDCIYPGV
jgi:hypothetical protein|tara:strand:- start:215 stop:322 length:108 start_codon:yes stop_codon:yes gene_type:complete